MKRSALLLIITTMVFVRIGYTQDEKGIRYAQLKPIEVTMLSSKDVAEGKLVLADGNGNVVWLSLSELSEKSGILSIENGGTGSTTQNWVDLTGGQTVDGIKTWSNQGMFNGGINVKGGVIVSGATSGAVSFNAPATGASGTYTLPSAPPTVDGYVLSSSGLGALSWVAKGSSDAVSSVGLSLPTSVFSITDSPVEDSGTLTGTFKNQSANTVFAAPNGSNGVPTFRTLVDADIPTISLTSKVSGVLSVSNGGTSISSYSVGDILYASGESALSKLTAGTSGYVLTSNGAATAPSWTAANAATSTIANDLASTSTVYPIWAAGTGAQELKISTTKLGFIPSKGAMTVNGMTVWGDATNSVLGTGAFAANTSGTYNIAVGTFALKANTTGWGNIAIGESSLVMNTVGGANLAIGRSALQGNTTGMDNVAVGYWSMLSNSDGEYNTALGVNSLKYNQNGSENTAIGGRALENALTGKQTAVGYMSLFNNTSGENNTAVGYGSLVSNTTGSFNTALGHQALASNTVLEGITAIGYQALYNLTDGTGGNVAIGYRSLYTSDDGEDNTAIGYQTLYSNEGGSYNVAIGGSALYSNTGGENNVAIGNAALFKNKGGEQNIAIGNNALRENTYGFGSTAIGIFALGDNLSGGYNSAFGRFAMSNNTTGSYNVAVGDNSGYGFSPSNSVYVGANTFSSNAAVNEIVIGAEAKGYGSHTINLNSTREPKLFIGNSAPNDQVYYEPLYYNKVGALGTVLAGQGTGVMPIWKDISITGEGIVTVSPNGKSEDLTWVIKAECCPIKIEVDKDGNLIFYQDGKLIEIESVDNGKTSMPIGLGLVYDSNTKQYNLPATGTKIKEYSTEFVVSKPDDVYTLEATPSPNCSPKVFLNGVRLRSTAYSITGDKLTYIEAGNIDIDTKQPVSLEVGYFFHVDYFADL